MTSPSTRQRVHGRDPNRSDAASRLAAVFAEVFHVPEDRILPNLTAADVVGWDSLGHVMLVTAIEREFSIQFDVDEIMEFTSFQAILSAIQRRMDA